MIMLSSFEDQASSFGLVEEIVSSSEKSIDWVIYQENEKMRITSNKRAIEELGYLFW